MPEYISGRERKLNVGIVSYSEEKAALSVVGNSNFTGIITATSFSKSGGTSSQFLKADGSVDSSTYLTSYTETQTLNDVLGLGNTSTIGLSVGVVTTTALKGFDYLQAPHGSTVNYAVTVAAKTAAHRYNGSGSGNGYLIDGVESPFLTLTPGRTYRFTLSSSDMSSHPFRFYLEADKTTAYTTNVTSTATYTEIVVTDTTPTVLHYQCSAHGYMGNAVQVNSNKVNTPYQIDGLKGANITGVVTATSFVGDITGDVTGNSDTATTATNAQGLTGSPDITITNVTGVAATFSGNVTIGGTLSYQDVENIDSIGIITAQQGIQVLANGLDITGFSTFKTGVSVTGVVTATTFKGSLSTNNLEGTITNSQLDGSIANDKLANSSIAIGGITFNLGDTDATPAFDLSDATDYPFTSLTGITTVISGDTTPTLGGNLGLNSKTINGTGNVNITGVITATSFVGNITGDVTGNADTATTLATARTIGGVSFDGSSSINLPGVNQSGTQNTSGTAAGLSGSPDIAVTNITSGIVTATSFVGSKLGISGLSTSKDLLVTGITSATNTIEIKSNDSTPGRIDLYCETNNAHYARLQAPPHAEFSGNITATLPASSGTLLHSDSSGNVIITGIVTASSFVGSLTGSASSLSGVSSSFLLDYNNFTNTPTIPTNNNQLTNGAGFITTSFTNTNQLTNGAGFITTSFTNTNQLTNGAGFITSSDDISGTAAGLTGTPNITVGSITAVSAEFSGNVTIGGTLSYEDVTNVDAVGILTAREGIQIPNDTAKLRAGADLELQLFHDGTNSVVKDTRNAGKVRIQADNFDIIDKDASETMLSATVDGAVELNYNGSKKLETTNTGVVVTGICTASAFVDDGTNLLTEINTKASTGKAIAMAMVFG